MSTQDFHIWFSENWEEAGGLVRPADAAALIGISRQAVSKALHTGKMKLYEHPEKGCFAGLRETLFKAAEKR